MKSILLLLLTLLTLSQYAIGSSIHADIEKDSVFLIDYYKNGNKKLESFYYVYVDEQGDTLFAATGKQTKYYEGGGIQGFQYFKNGVLHGKSELYSEHGTLFKTFYFINGKLEGPYIFYFPDGKVMRTGIFKNDLDYGLSKSYHPNGQLAIEESYNEYGIQEGEVKIYNNNGDLIKQEIMYNGRKKK